MNQRVVGQMLVQWFSDWLIGLLSPWVESRWVVGGRADAKIER
jgi:hypothetical protein